MEAMDESEFMTEIFGDGDGFNFNDSNFNWNLEMDLLVGDGEITNNGVDITDNANTANSAMLADLADPTDNDFSLTLAVEGDDIMLCDAHVTIRKDILLIRRTMNGNIFFQCKYCMNKLQHQKCRTIIPRSLDGIKRSVITFKTKHIPVCAFIPEEVKEKTKVTTPKRAHGREPVSKYWIKSALDIGLSNGNGRIVWTGVGN